MKHKAEYPEDKRLRDAKALAEKFGGREIEDVVMFDQVSDIADMLDAQDWLPLVDKEAQAAQAEPDAWMTHHDEPMFFRTREEAASYCNDDEDPIPLRAPDLASQAEPAAVPKGMALVPIEPTDDMLDAATTEEVHTCEQGDPYYQASPLSESDARKVWNVMLAAAPTPPAGEAPSDGLPYRIWLQAYGDSSPDAGPPPDVTTSDVSWCWHKVHEHDVEYRRVGAGEGAEAGVKP